MDRGSKRHLEEKWCDSMLGHIASVRSDTSGQQQGKDKMHVCFCLCVWESVSLPFFSITLVSRFSLLYPHCHILSLYLLFLVYVSVFFFFLNHFLSLFLHIAPLFPTRCWLSSCMWHTCGVRIVPLRSSSWRLNPETAQFISADGPELAKTRYPPQRGSVCNWLTCFPVLNNR